MAIRVWIYRLIKQAYPFGGLIAPLTKLPVVNRVVDALLFRGDDVYIVPRDEVVPGDSERAATRGRVVPVDRVIDVPDDVALPSQVVEHFIRQAKHRWIMKECLCRAGQGCEDYPIELGCLFLGEAATRIDPTLGYPVTEEEALAHLRRCRDAGLVHLIGRNRIDSLWLGVTPSDRLLTICHCCPCCCIWRLLPRLPRAVGRKVTRMPGVEVRVTERCTGCGACADTCFVSAIRLGRRSAAITEACLGCGRCVSVCPEEAIELRISGHPADRCAEQLSRLVNVR